MAEKPILFNAEMVNAVLDGRKTQTRRVVKPQPPKKGGVRWFARNTDGVTLWKLTDEAGDLAAAVRCPYGVVGDRLWVRESFSPWGDGVKRAAYRATSTVNDDLHKWKPSIHMPRWASRITLEVTDVGVERVQDISDQAALAEGVRIPVSASGSVLWNMSCAYPPTKYMPYRLSEHAKHAAKAHGALVTRAHFAALWDSINDKRGYGWEKNPWVWVVSFKVIEVKGGAEQ